MTTTTAHQHETKASTTKVKRIVGAVATKHSRNQNSNGGGVGNHHRTMRLLKAQNRSFVNEPLMQSDEIQKIKALGKLSATKKQLKVKQPSNSVVVNYQHHYLP